MFKKANKKLYILLAIGGFLGGITIGTIQSLNRTSPQVEETVQESVEVTVEESVEDEVQEELGETGSNN